MTEIEGIWRLDFYGSHGWETVGTLTLSAGRVSGGSITHFTSGSYSVDGEAITMQTVVNFYGSHKPFFGNRSNTIAVTLEGRVDGDTITGEETSPDGPGYSYTARLTRQAGLG